MYKKNISLGIIIVCFMGLFTFMSASNELVHFGFSSKKYSINKFAQFTSANGEGSFSGVFVGVSAGDDKPSSPNIGGHGKFFFGTGGDFEINNRYKIKETSLFSFSYEMSKRIYLSYPIYISPKAGLGLYSVRGKLFDFSQGSTESVSITSYSGLVGVDLGVHLAPYKELLFSVDYDASIANSKAQLENDYESEADVSHGLSISVSIRLKI